MKKVIDLSSGEENIIINPNQYQLGRSVYLCKSAPCIKEVLKGKKLAKILKVSNKSVEKILPELDRLIGREVLSV